MSNVSTIDWAALRAPFNPNEVDFRVQSNLNNGSAIVLAYMDARLVQNRLDEVVGPENWSFDWTPVGTKGDTITAAKGTLTICGISKSDVGDAGQTEPTKSTVSDAFKRAAVMWGIGRYLYDLGTTFCKVDQKGKIPEAELRQLRANLPKPNGYKAPSVSNEARSDAHASPYESPASPEMCQALVELAAELGRATHKVPANLTHGAAQSLGKQWQAEKKAKSQSSPARQATGNATTTAESMATDRQITSIRKLCAALGRPEPEVATLTFAAARELLTSLSQAYSEARQAS